MFAGLTATEKEDLLLQFLIHDDAATRRKLRRRLRDRGTSVAAKSSAGKNRRTPGSGTVGELAAEWRRRVSIAQQRAAEAAARERARLAEAQARARHAHLTQVVTREAAAWNKVESHIQSRSPKGYDQAVILLADLRDAAALVKQTDRFGGRLRDLRAAHASKPSLIRRMDVAELR